MENNQCKTSQLLYWLHVEIIIFWKKCITLTSLLSFYILNGPTRKSEITYMLHIVFLLDIASLDILLSLHGPWGISVSHYIVKNSRLSWKGWKEREGRGSWLWGKKLALCLKLYGFMLKCTCICKYLFLWLCYKSRKYHFYFYPTSSLTGVTFLF